MRLTEHFTLEELCLSQFAIRNGLDNTPSAAALSNLTQLCEITLEPLRRLVGAPVIVSSGFRSEVVNKAIGGSTDSQHCKGEAADVTVPNVSVEDLFHLAVKNIPFDQAIQEFGRWLHISYREKPRGQALRAIKSEGRTIYQPAWISK